MPRPGVCPLLRDTNCRAGEDSSRRRGHSNFYGELTLNRLRPKRFKGARMNALLSAIRRSGEGFFGDLW